ncbi:GNAT family protein [Burkholderia sp. BCC1977]|uniref:GNAT family N-acetyltransferase n=1 Tax=Burkholderia sp. BCC1977 TaxID=2817440 RepID=UPI002ABDCB69|nr:GNAT family protein [Burkholderia sp. BCC1977]
MSVEINEYGQPVGASMPDWTDRPLPADVTLQGRFCRLEPLDAQRHARDLFAAYSSAPDGRDWTYLPIGPFRDESELLRYAESAARSTDPKHYTVIDTVLNRAVGALSLMRADVKSGSVEVGWVMFSPLIKQRPASTEAQFLLMQYVFDELRYRRYEWKCDSLNDASRKAAQRLGFSFEGIFRQVTVYKQRSRDTAWFSIVDREWPGLKQAFQAWLAPENFDDEGRQISTLTEIRS